MSGCIACKESASGVCTLHNGAAARAAAPSVEAHEPHHGNHDGYACGFSGPHCWECHEPWPCRTERGLNRKDGAS